MLLCNNRHDLPSGSLRQSQVHAQEIPNNNTTNLEKILGCYQTSKTCARPAVSFGLTTPHHPDPMNRTGRAPEVSPESSPIKSHESSTQEHSGSDERLPQLIPVHTSKQLQELPLVFAVEASSTSEKVFKEEKNAISYLNSKLEPTQLAKQSYILPWDPQARDPVPANLVETIHHSFGSDPSTIFENSLSLDCFQKSKIWFLMTDGVIEEERTNAFANGITDAGLHGTPSVIIVFGNRSRPPSRSKLSIGMSVCAASPHCTVLFHDVWSSELFIIQAKGCFASLLPKGSYFKWFSGTKWTDFPQTSYDRLLRVWIPEPIRLSKDQVALPYSKVFDMKSIYNDSMSKKDKLQLVSNNSALDTIMVVAKTRGEAFLVKLWIESLRRTLSRKDMVLERDDVNSRGKLVMTFLLMAAEQELKAQNTRHKDVWSCLTSAASPHWSRCMQMHVSSHLDFYRESVRLQNKKNWSNFEDKVEIEREAFRRVTKGLQEVQSAIGILDKPFSDGPPASLPNTLWYPASGIKKGRSKENPSASVQPTDLDKRRGDMIFLSGFKGSRNLVVNNKINCSRIEFSAPLYRGYS